MPGLQHVVCSIKDEVCNFQSEVFSLQIVVYPLTPVLAKLQAGRVMAKPANLRENKKNLKG